MSKKYNIILDMGTDYSLTLNVKNKKGQPVDMTKYNIYCQVRNAKECENIIDSLTQANNRIVIDSETTAKNKIHLIFPHGVTKKYPITSAVYDVIMVDKEYGMVTRMLEGTFTAKIGVTKI